MKIVEICAFYSAQGGGVRTYVDRKLIAAPRFGHRLTVIVPGPADKIEDKAEGSRLITVASPRLPLDHRYHYFDDEARIHALLDAERPEVAEASSQWRAATMLCDWTGSASRVLFMHSDPLAAYAYRWLGPLVDRHSIDNYFEWYWRHLRRLDQQFDCVVSASPSLSGRLSGGGLSKVATIPMGVEPGLFSPELRDETVRQALLRRCSLGSDGLLLLGVGRMAPEKRWPLVIDAVAAAGFHHPVGLVLVGTGRGRSKVAKLIADNPHMQLLEPIADRGALARLMASADALIHGCEAETFCIAAAEARASGLPLIVPDQGGAADQYRPGIDRMYASGRSAAAAEAILEWAPGGHDRGRAVAAAADVRTMDDHFAQLFGVYENLARGIRTAA